MEAKFGNHDEPPITASSPSDQQRWLDLLNRADRGAMVDHFLRELRTIPDYAQPLIPLSEIRQTAHRSFAALLSGLATDDRSEFQAIATRTGATRARAGVPMASLLTAVRLDFTVLWHELLRVATPEDSEVLLHHASRVWQFVDDYARAVHHEYQAEERRRTSSESLVVRGLLTELFGQKSPTPARIDSIASGLGTAVDSVFCLAVAGHNAVHELQGEIAGGEREGLALFTLYDDDQLILFFPTHDVPGDRYVRLVERLSRLPVGIVAEVRGMAQLRSACTLARELSALAANVEDGAVTPERGWPTILRHHLERSGLSLGEEVELALSECGQAERRNIVESVAAYLETGSVSEVAARIFCHRNTVTNRLHRFHDITGIDVTVPAQAARLVISWA